MIGGDFPDKVTEYHILNAQLMSKAMLLLDTAHGLMENNETVKRNDDSTLEHYTQADEEDAKNEKTPSKSSKFTFPDHESVENLYSGAFPQTASSFSENEVDFEPMPLVQAEQTDRLVDRLLKTKISLQQNGIRPEERKQEDKVTKNCLNVMKTKCEHLSEELRVVQEKLRKKIAECEEQSKLNQSLQETRVRLMTQINNLKSQAIKKDGKISALNSKIQVVEAEFQVVSGERDSLAKSAKGVVQEVSATELRLTRALGEIASLKEALNTCRQEEKEGREASRKQLDKLTNGLKMAEKREKTLLTAVKKQALLMDNLKKQINYLTNKQCVNASENQLDSILKWESK